MKMTRMMTMTKRVALPLLTCGLLWSGQVLADDIVSMKSTHAGQIFTASGSEVEFRITLAGKFEMVDTSASILLNPELRMVVNGTVAYATLYSYSQYTIAGGTIDRTDMIFKYTTKPGDMAQPLKIYGSETPPIPYQFNWNGWEVRNSTTSSNAVWKFNDTLSLPSEGETYDLDLSKQNITIRNLSFSDAHSPVSVAATENNTWRVSTVNPIESAVVDFYVWTPGTNVLQLGSVPNQTALLVSMPTGSTYIDFPVKGLAIGTTFVYLQRTADYANNFTAVGMTNYIRRAITVTAAPEPTVRVILTDTASDNTTLSETSTPNTGEFRIELSQAYGSNVTVRLDTLPAGQSNLTFATSPFYVTVPAGSLVSPSAKFSVVDGTVLSASAGVTLTPVITNAISAGVYTRRRDASVYVNNVKPTILLPLATDVLTATQNEPFKFDWSINDVVADQATGMRIRWTYGDGSTNEFGHGAAGSIFHTYTTTGSRQVKVTAYDKDGGVSDEVQFTVNIVPPTTKPHVWVKTNADVYDETSTNNTGSLVIYLSEPAGFDTWVRLNTDPAVQSNVLFSSGDAVRIPQGSTNTTVRYFSIPDGTDFSSGSGIMVTPSVTNPVAAAYYTDLRSTTLYVNNLRPRVVAPVAGDLLLPSVAPYNTVPMGSPYVFDYVVSDVPADQASMRLYWRFESGGAMFTVTGAVGQIANTYTTLGDKIVTVYAVDKDGGVSDTVQFKVTVVTPPPPPTVRILPPPGALPETTSPNTGSFIVQLSQTFTNAVTVSLASSPVNNAANGTIQLATNRVVFGIGETEKTVKFSARDGTDISWTTGFTITPTVIGNAAAVAYFTEVTPGTIELYNINPVITTPVASDITAATYVYEVAQGSPWTFNWVVSDVPADLTSTPIATAMTVTWYFGDGTTGVGYGATGSINHTYTALGDIIVRMVAQDKDGGFSEVQFKIRVKPSKAINVTPVGPNMEAGLSLLPGIGNGMVISREAISSDNRNNTYFFKYNPNVVATTLEALPYKTHPLLGFYYVTNFNASGVAVPNTTTPILYDSFFYAWVGSDQGLAETQLDPATATQVATVTLPTSTDTGTGSTTAAVEIREIQAIFSREWRVADNMGDINQDGIPDKVATWISSQIDGAGGGDTADLRATALVALNAYNDDQDFLPVNPTGIGGRFDFRPIADPNTPNGAVAVNAFTAIREVRGYHLGLNRAGISDPDGIADEPNTNPTMIDTDGDGFPDGWEYYFYYNARFQGMTGSAYNPADVANGLTIASQAVWVYFQPSVYGNAGDLDNDGLLDVEELTLGTNPIHWDTDGDGMCDGWEVMQTLDPNDPTDGGSSNPDGDYMAIATVARQFVTTVTGGTVTNTYLAIGAEVASAEGEFTTWYNYGSSNAPITVGRPVNLPANTLVVNAVETNALILHYQVNHEFGFEPRTAWIFTMNYRAPTYARFPTWIDDAPNTRAFTSLDEYLLMKFVAENRLNGNGGTVAPTVASWLAVSTHPTTPDSDINVITKLNDGMPDGWELYVSIRPGLDLTVAANRNMTISPWSPYDGAVDHPVVPLRDGLVNRREFAGTESSGAYTNTLLYNLVGAVGYVSIARPGGDLNWLNKFWPTDPWNPDTDGDGLSDGAEQTFVYLPAAPNAADNFSRLIQGGGLNPNAMDTDFDALPDKWELEFTGTLPPVAIFNGLAITNGMDGTYNDSLLDWDRDGLRNYQEYWVQGVRSLRYDIPADGTVGPITGNEGLPMDASYLSLMLFTLVDNDWDLSKYPWGDTNPQLWVMLPVGAANLYVSTDPRNPDSDHDGMDDYYEMFHGLNPILGAAIRPDYLDDRICRAYIDNGLPVIDYGTPLLGNDWGAGLPMNFADYPWLAGMPEADPDADGLLNLEEMLLVNSSAPSNYNTDPTPLWMTEPSSPNAVTMRFYQRFIPFIPPMYFWPFTQVPLYMYDYEANEGYDTDNDGLSDKAELIDSRNNQSSPQDHDDPMRRQALWFSGNNSAASTVTFFDYFTSQDAQLVGDIELGFRSFTVELWARPEVVNREQILIERSFYYGPSDASTAEMYVRRNFRVGIAADGRIYGTFDNAGVHDEHTASVMAYGHVLEPNQWIHVAVRMDGLNQAFTLFLNGEVQSVVETALVPANGIVIIRDYPTSQPYEVVLKSGALVLGAANNAPLPLDTLNWSWDQGWADYDKFYQGWIDEVRIWDGARDNASIIADYKKRFTWNDLWDNRALVAQQVARGYTRVATNSRQLAPLLLHHYTFDNLFGADATASVATSPRGFNYPAVDVNRPLAAPGAEVPWWAATEIRSTVYTDYKYLPWIENGYDHMPLFGGTSTNGTGGFTLLMTNSVHDSVYWTQTAAADGSIIQDNSFPNRCNPYGVYYKPQGTSPYVTYLRDLLPLGDAWVRQADFMWDLQGPAEAWMETGADTDSDGLPDWWESYITGNPGETALNWNDLFPDGSGMTYGERYQRDVALGATPSNPSGAGGLKQTADSDGDGLPDWWEKIYNLNPNLPGGNGGRNGAGGDPDRDGLSNLAEYLVSEVYGFHYLNPLQPKTSPQQVVTDYYLKQGALTLGAMFSDHDFMEDSWEDQYDPYFVNRFVYDALLDYDEDGWSNWAESRYARNALKSDPSLGMHLDLGGVTTKDFPTPVIETRLSYDGLQAAAPIVVHAFSDPEMNGNPDAIFTLAAPAANGAGTAMSKMLGFWGAKKITGYLSPGSVVPGSILLSFTDVSIDAYKVTGVVAFDVYSDPTGKTGTIMGTDRSGWEGVIGTINYITGYYEIDLSWFQGVVFYVGTGTVRAQLNPETSFVTVAYQATQVAGWPKTIYLTDADVGYVREGKNRFFAFLDVNASGTWDAGEPCGVAAPFVTDVNWDVNRIRIELTDYTPNYLRMTLQPGVRSEDIYLGSGGGQAGGGTGGGTANLETRVRVQRAMVDGAINYNKVVLDKVLRGRTYLHEGDFLAQGQMALDWGLTDVPTTMNRWLVGYNVYVGDGTILTNNTHVLTFTNRFDAAQGAAQAVSPINGAYVYSARPTFRWTMPAGYNAFALELRKGSPTGPVVYESGVQQAPPRDTINGQYVWEAPVHAGNRLPSGHILSSNTVYAWRVIPLNPKFVIGDVSTISATAWSGWKMFRLDVNAPMQSSGYGEIKAVVKYHGPSVALLSGNVKVEVFRNRGFTGVPAARYTLTDTENGYLVTPGTTNINAVVRGLSPSSSVGAYYVRAFIDQNGNDVRDAWESWGYANYYGVTDTPFDVKPFAVAFEITDLTQVASLVIEDVDTDQDWFPDSWEYENALTEDFLNEFGPSSNWSELTGDTEVNPDLLTGAPFANFSIFSALALGTTDRDGDGIDDIAELLLGTDVSAGVSATDGYGDADKIALGLAPQDALALSLTGLQVTVDTTDVAWTLSVNKSAAVNRSLLALVTGVNGTGSVRYSLEYTTSLASGAWVPVETGDVALDGTKTILGRIDARVTDPAKGFFRVRLIPN